MYLGEPGRMVRIKCPTSLQVTPAGRHSFTTTLGGTVKAQVGPKARRTWDVRLGPLSTPADVGVLMDFVNGSWGLGPWWFIPSDAPVVNLLPPDVAVCDPEAITFSGGAELLGSPPMNLGNDGYAARAVWKTSVGRVDFGPPIPVLPDVPVTGSAWVEGGGNLGVFFLDSAGAIISSALSDPPHSANERVSVTATPPEGAITVRLSAMQGISHATRPALTWTDQPYEWGDGQGCVKAVVHNTSRDLVKAWDDPRTGRWSDLSFTVQEIG